MARLWGEGIITARRIPLAVAGFTAINDADWTVSNPDANTLRLVKGTAGAVGWTATLEDGLCLHWGEDLGATDQGLLCQVILKVSAIPDTTGLIIGAGLTEHASSPVGANWAAMLIEREAGSTVKAWLNSDTVNNAGSTGLTDTELGFQQLYGAGGGYGWTCTAGTIGSRVTKQSGYKLTTAQYPVILAGAGAAGGTVDITALAVHSRAIEASI